MYTDRHGGQGECARKPEPGDGARDAYIYLPLLRRCTLACRYTPCDRVTNGRRELRTRSNKARE